MSGTTEAFARVKESSGRRGMVWADWRTAVAAAALGFWVVQAQADGLRIDPKSDFQWPAHHYVESQLQPTLLVLAEAFGREPGFPIEVYRRWDNPKVDLVSGVQRLGITASENYWMRYSYQFGLAADTAALSWYSRFRPQMEENATIRSLNFGIAFELLPHFVQDPELWKACGYLNRWDTSRNLNFRDYLTSWTLTLARNGERVDAADLVTRLLYRR